MGIVVDAVVLTSQPETAKRKPARASWALAALTVLAVLVACGGERGRRPAGDGEAFTTAAAETSKRPLGAGRQKLDAGSHLLDLAALDHTATRPAHLPKIAITVPGGWFNYDGWAVQKRRDSPLGLRDVLGRRRRVSHALQVDGQGRGWSSDRYQQKPGQVDRIWNLDVDGRRLVVDASYLPEATASDRAELERVLDSIRFLD